MRRYSPSYYSPPRRGYGGRGRSPPRRVHGGYGGRREQNHGSLLVRNIPLDCRPEDLRVPFERFGVVRDVYLPKDYYSGEPRGFAFVQFIDPHDAAEAQYHMNRQLFGGREITVVLAAETRKRPEEMRGKSRSSRGHRGYEERRPSYYGRSRSRSRSPRFASSSRARQRSRSYSPAPRRADYSPSPERRHARSPRDRSPRGQGEDHHGDMRPHSSRYEDAKQKDADNVYSKRSSYDATEEERGPRRSSPSRFRSPSGSRSRSADLSPRHPSR